MTDATQEPQDQQDEYDDEAPEVIEPEDAGAAPLSPDDEVDPVTVRNTDPAAMSEQERNARLTDRYNNPI